MSGLPGRGVLRKAARQSGGPLSGTRCRSASHTAASLSLGARQSPRGYSEPPEPTFGALAMQLRLYWLS